MSFAQLTLLTAEDGGEEVNQVLSWTRRHHPGHPGRPARRTGRLRRRTRALLRRGARARRVGVMGGTFDPIHHGHLVAASEVQAWFDLDEVVFVPTGDPVAEVRPRGLAGRAPVPDDRDRHRRQPAVHRLARRHRPRRADVHHRHAARPACGAARRRAVLHHRRRRAGRHLHLALGRGPVRARAVRRLHAARARDGRAALAGIPADRVTMVEIPALAISSTDCRERTRRGEPVWYLVPDGVVQYIAKHGLYARSRDR